MSSDTDTTPASPRVTQKILREWQEDAYDFIKNVVNNGGHHLVWILMALGKTYAAGTLAADPAVEHPLTVLSRQVDTREQVQEHALEAGLAPSKIKLLPRFREHCPTAAGEHDDIPVPGDWDITWSQLLAMLQRQKVAPSEMHKRLGEHLPCQHEGQCPYAEACDFDIDTVELLIGHPVHAYVPSYVEGRAVLFDEVAAQEFQYSVAPDEYTAAINTFLENHLDIDATTKNDLIRASDEEQEAWREAIQDRGQLIDPDIGYSSQGGRADAPLLALGILDGAPVANSEVENTNLRRTTIGDIVVLYDEGKGNNIEPVMMVRNPPAPLSSAWAVVAMDGTPTQAVWEGGLGLELEFHEFMTSAERQHYIRDVLNYNIVQLTENRTVPATKPQNITDWVFNGFLHEIREQHDRRVPVITPLKTKRVLDEEYVSNAELHPGKVRSRSELEAETLLAVLGSIHPGDRAIQRLAALDGHAVECNGKSGVDKSYGEIGNRYYRHLVHHEVAQSIFRVGRSSDTTGADIYVYTCLIPDWIPREIVTEQPKQWPAAMKKVQHALEKHESATTERLAEETVVCKSAVRGHLYTLRDLDAVRGVSEYRYKEWVDTGIRDLNPYGQFSIEP